MTRDQVKEKIKEKFGTYSKFAKLAKIDRYQFQKNFLTAKNVSPADIEKYSELCDKLKDKSFVPVLTKKKRKSIREEIEKRGGVIRFCQENTEFAESTVFQILSDVYVTTITPTVERLIKTLGV